MTKTPKLKVSRRKPKPKKAKLPTLRQLNEQFWLRIHVDNQAFTAIQKRLEACEENILDLYAAAGGNPLTDDDKCQHFAPGVSPDEEPEHCARCGLEPGLCACAARAERVLAGWDAPPPRPTWGERAMDWLSEKLWVWSRPK